MSSLSEYDFELPAELIAQQPLATRSDARLLVVDRKRQSLHHSHVRDLPEFVTPQDALVLNNTRVIPARLVGLRAATGGRWTGLFLEADAAGNWRLLSKTRGKLRVGETVVLQDRAGRDDTTLRLLDKRQDGTWVAYPESRESIWEILQRVGRVPLPHYIRGGEMLEQDQHDYQTVFAEASGAIAAPTAGLHFTPELLQRLRQTGTGIVKITLHVGIGTFRPITVTSLDEHRMHEEWCEISASAAEQLNAWRRGGGRIIAVGTTVVRTLESAVRNGGGIQPWKGGTDLFIRPPYQFQAVDGLMTNFHLPRSTLLVLVRTFGGDNLIRRAYTEAIHQRYRFFSYGDAMLIL